MPSADVPIPPMDGRLPGDALVDMRHPGDAALPVDASTSTDTAPTDARPAADAVPAMDAVPGVDAWLTDGPRPWTDGFPGVDGPRPVVDANPTDAGSLDARPVDALLGVDAAQLMDLSSPADALPDAVVDSSVPCDGGANACGACGVIPAEVCNGVDDNCDGQIDEGDADADGLNDCAELVSGLNPADPSDAIGDLDRDGVSNVDEVAAGTWARPVLSLRALPVDPPGDPTVLEVGVELDQPAIELQPILIEIFLHLRGPTVFEDAVAGEAALLAEKDIFYHPMGEDTVRFTLTAANLIPIGSGELARLRFRRTTAAEVDFTFAMDAIQFAPVESQNVLTFGTGHDAQPLTYGRTTPLVINEVDYDQISTDTAEFVEILNPTPLSVPLAGVRLESRNGLTAYRYMNLALQGAAAELLPGQRLVVGMPPVLALLPADVPSALLPAPMPNFAVTVRLMDTNVDPPVPIDVLGWEGADPAQQLAETLAAGEDPLNRANVGLSRCPDGADTDNNAHDFVLEPITPGRTNVCP